MADEIKEKIMYEYELFFLDCMRQSKSGIYARSEEIEMKKRLCLLLRAMADNGKLSSRMLVLDNILEELYRYVKDQGMTGNTEESVKKWTAEI